MTPRQSTALIRVGVLAKDLKIREAAESLSPGRFEVGLSDTPEAFLERYSSLDRPLDVAIIELRLNGFSVAKELRATSPARVRKIVMVPDRPQDEWLCRQAGAEFVIVKPISDTSTLKSAIESVLTSL